MITLKLESAIGLIEISGNNADELLKQVAQLEGSHDLFTAAGRVASMKPEVDAKASAGKYLGASVVEEVPKQEAPPVDTPEKPQEPFSPPSVPGMGVPPIIAGGELAQPAIDVPFEGRTRNAWWGPKNAQATLPATDDPNDPEIAKGRMRFWKWVD